MGIVFSVVLLNHIVVAIGVITLVLLQHGKGADMGAASGSGSSGQPVRLVGIGQFPESHDSGAGSHIFLHQPCTELSRNESASLGGEFRH